MSQESSQTGLPASEHEYELFYWPGFPGRGEHIRLAFEAAGVPYRDVALENDARYQVESFILPQNEGDASSPPPLAPPILRHGTVVLSQTPNILLYLGPRLGLVPADRLGAFHVNALTMTILDGLSNAPHDVHHPIALMWNYEDQREAALLKAQDYRATRLPKWLEYFERVLCGPASGGGQYLYGGCLTYADLVLFHALEGITFAFPRCIDRLKSSGHYEKVFALQDRVRSGKKIRAYCDSGRRQDFGKGLYRYYPELDDAVELGYNSEQGL